MAAGWERWNTHWTTSVEQELMGRTLHLVQDPNSEHLGTTVWDASIVMAKYLEKNARKGEFSRAKVRGKRAIELGAGMGLGGMAFAMLGADVVLTDVKEVLPLLRINYERNLSPAACRASDGGSQLASQVGTVEVAELDWAEESHVAAVNPPFDFVLAADCIYHEHLLKQLFRTVLAITNDRSTVIICNERRSESVQSTFLELFQAAFVMRKVPLSKHDPVHQHPAIELYTCKRRKGASLDVLHAMEAAEADAVAAAVAGMQLLAEGPPVAVEQTVAAADAQATGQGTAAPDEGGVVGREERKTADARPGDESSGAVAGVSCDVLVAHASASGADTNGSSSSSSSSGSRQRPHRGHSNAEPQAPGPMPTSTAAPPPNGSLDGHGGASSHLDWQTRRQGAMAARLLAAVQVPTAAAI